MRKYLKRKSTKKYSTKRKTQKRKTQKRNNRKHRKNQKGGAPVFSLYEGYDMTEDAEEYLDQRTRTAASRMRERLVTRVAELSDTERANETNVFVSLLVRVDKAFREGCDSRTNWRGHIQHYDGADAVKLSIHQFILYKANEIAILRPVGERIITRDDIQTAISDNAALSLICN